MSWLGVISPPVEPGCIKPRPQKVKSIPQRQRPCWSSIITLCLMSFNEMSTLTRRIKVKHIPQVWFKRLLVFGLNLLLFKFKWLSENRHLQIPEMIKKNLVTHSLSCLIYVLIRKHHVKVNVSQAWKMRLIIFWSEQKREGDTGSGMK